MTTTNTAAPEGLVVGVTSKKGGVGKSVVATLIAWASEQLDRRAVLLDLDPSNPDQLARDRARFAKVPERMPTVIDDAYPSQWWSDPESGVQLVPGPREDRDRTDHALITGAHRLVPRARAAADIVVLDLHQLASDEYSKQIVDLCDLLVCVTDHDRQSREHLRAWLDGATAEPPGDDPYLPSIDRERVRLVYSEGIQMSTNDAVQARAEARADMGARYQWVGQLDFDPNVVTGGNRGDLTRSINVRTRTSALELAAVLIDDRPRVRRQAIASPRPTEPRTPGAAPDAPWAAPQGTAELSRQDVMRIVRVFGTPRIEGGPPLPEREAAIVALLAVRAPLSTGAVAEILDVRPKTISNTVSGLKGIVASEHGVLTLDFGVRSEITIAANLAESLATSRDRPVEVVIEQALAAIASVQGPPFDIPTGGRWSWVHERLHAGLTPAERALLELNNLARNLASRWVAERASGAADLPSGSTLTDALLAACQRASWTTDPLPLLTAAATVAERCAPVDRALVTSRLTAVAQEGWPVPDELVARLRSD